MTLNYKRIEYILKVHFHDKPAQQQDLRETEHYCELNTQIEVSEPD